MLLVQLAPIAIRPIEVALRFRPKPALRIGERQRYARIDSLGVRLFGYEGRHRR